jgi:hypothetical protein
MEARGAFTSRARTADQESPLPARTQGAAQATLTRVLSVDRQPMPSRVRAVEEARKEPVPWTSFVLVAFGRVRQARDREGDEEDRPTRSA